MNDPTKRCAKCGEVKPHDEFNRAASAPDVLQRRCRDCQHRQYEASREAVAAGSRLRYQANREAILTQHREYHAANREKMLTRQRQYHAANREARNMQVRNRAAAIKAEVLAHYGTRCACCCSTEQLSIDHMNGDGGSHREELFGRRYGGGRQFWRWLIDSGFPEGFQTLCRRCNLSKGQRQRCTLNHDGGPR